MRKTSVPLVTHVSNIKLCEPRKKDGARVVRFDLTWGVLVPGADAEDSFLTTHKGCTAKYDMQGNVTWSYGRNMVGGRFYETAYCTKALGARIKEVLLGTPALMALLEETRPGWTKVLTEIELVEEPEPEEKEPRTR